MLTNPPKIELSTIIFDDMLLEGLSLRPIYEHLLLDGRPALILKETSPLTFTLSCGVRHHLSFCTMNIFSAQALVAMIKNRQLPYDNAIFSWAAKGVGELEVGVLLVPELVGGKEIAPPWMLDPVG